MKNYHQAKADTKIPKCVTCNSLIDDGIAVYLPTQEVIDTYHKLKKYDKDSAVRFLESSEHSFLVYCLRCWIHNYIINVAFNTKIPYKSKLSLIDEHMSDCTQGVEDETLCQWLGVAEWN